MFRHTKKGEADTADVPLTGSQDRHIVVVGGGVIGVCCAYFLAKRGARVTVVERDQIGRAASFGNAGSIAPGHPPINKPGRARQALKSLFDPLSPLYVAPRFDPVLASWLWSFTQACSEEHVEYSMKILAPLGHASRALFDELIETERLRCRLEQLTNAARRYLKTIEAPTIKSEWCGLRPCLPDGLPALGPVSRYPGLFVATGHAMMGLTLGPVTGKLISECVLDGSPSVDVTVLRPDRF